MKDFRFYCPVNMSFGNGLVEKLPAYVAPAKNVFVVTGLSAARKTGFLDRVKDILKNSGAANVAHAAAPQPLCDYRRDRSGTSA